MTWKSGSAAAKSNGFWAQNHWEWHYFSTPRHSRQLLWIMALKPAFNMTQHYYRVAVVVDDDDDDDTEEVWDVDSVMVGEELMTAEWNVHSSLSLLDGQWGSQLSMLGLWPTTACSRVFIHQRLIWLINQFADHILIRSISPESILTVQSFRL